MFLKTIKEATLILVMFVGFTLTNFNFSETQGTEFPWYLTIICCQVKSSISFFKIELVYLNLNEYKK